MRRVASTITSTTGAAGADERGRADAAWPPMCIGLVCQQSVRFTKALAFCLGVLRPRASRATVSDHGPPEGVNRFTRSTSSEGRAGGDDLVEQRGCGRGDRRATVEVGASDEVAPVEVGDRRA